MNMRFGCDLVVLVLVGCCIGILHGQALTSQHKNNVQEAMREQQILEVIRREVIGIVEKTLERTVKPLLERYTIQMQHMSEAMSNMSYKYANLSSQVEEFQNNIDNGTAGFTCPGKTWIRHDQRCYFFSLNQRSWSSAKTDCAAMKAHLAVIPTADINIILKDEARKRGDTYWIGGHDIHDEGNWIWENTGATIGYFNWGPDQPNNVRMGQDCLELLQKFAWEWNDRECTITQQYICETRLVYTIVRT